jgi:hypothetical protein
MGPEELVTLILEHLGAHVRKIPHGEGRTPDFIATIGGARYLIELKAKGEDPEREVRRNEVLNRGEIAEDHDTVGRKNVIAGVVADAVTQLREFSSEPVDYRLVWLLGWGRLRKLYFDQFESALYGTTNIFDLGPGADQYTRPCYYFGLSDFFRHRDILDGAIIWCDENGRFLINDLSPRYDAFRNSPLAEAMAKGRIDPREKEKQGDAYYADGDVDPRNEGAVLQYLQQKYGKPRLMNIQMGYHAAAMAVPRE